MGNSNKRRQIHDLLETAERRAFVLNLRKAGATYEQIAQAAIQEFGTDRLPRGWDRRYAFNDVKRTLQKLNRECSQDVTEIRRIDNERVLAAIHAISSQTEEGDLGAIDRLIKLLARRARLWGLDKPIDIKQELEITWPSIDEFLREYERIQTRLDEEHTGNNSEA